MSCDTIYQESIKGNDYYYFFSPMKMGMADAIVDLVSSGTTLRENNLKEIEGGVVLESQVTPSHTCRRMSMPTF